MSDELGNDAPQRATPQAETAEPSFDSTQLLEQFDSVVGNNRSANTAEPVVDNAARTPVTEANPRTAAEPEQLLMTNAFENVDSFTRGVKAAKGPGDKAPADKARDTRIPLPPPRPGDPPPFDIVGRPANFDPAKPTAVVLDSFIPGQDTQNFSGRGQGDTHGGTIATAAERNGFNVFRLQDKLSNGDFSKSLQGIEKKIDSGELPLKAGDVINISMGGTDLSFDQMSQVLGFPVTADTLAQNRDKIIDTFRKMREESDSPGVREAAGAIVDSNDAIKRLQERGISVIHAAGNDGADRFSPQFMNAQMQFGSQKPDGTFDGFSPTHNLLTPGGDGVFAVQANGFDMFDATPAAQQRGFFQLQGTNVKFPIGLFDTSAMGNNAKAFDRSAVNIPGIDPANPDAPRSYKLPDAPRQPLPTSIFDAPVAPLQAFKRGPLAAPEAGDQMKTPGLEKPALNFMTTMKTQPVKLEVSDTRPVDGTRATSVIAGSSFSVIRWFEQEGARRAAIRGGSR